MKWLVTIQDDQAKTISFEVNADELEWKEDMAYFGSTVRPVFEMLDVMLAWRRILEDHCTA